MKKVFWGHLFTVFILTLCTTVIGFSSPVTLPQPTGPYAVGTKAIELETDTRQMFRDATPRRWMVQAFYPSKPHGGTYPYMPGTLEDGMVEGIQVLSYAKPNAELIRMKTLPVIIFVPGLGAERQKYTILCEDLASHGYVVLSLDQPYVSNFVKFPDGTKIVLTIKDAWYVPRDRDYRYRYYDEAMAGAIEDIRFMLDHLENINTLFFDGELDQNKIILMGHSFGGNVAHALGFTDQRVKAIVDIDSKITERKIYGRIGVPPNVHARPVFFIRGMMQYQEDVGDQMTKIPNATIWSPDVQHSAFSDGAFLTRHILGFGHQNIASQFWNWFWKTGPFYDSVDTNIGDRNIDQWVREYRARIVDWLKKQKFT